MKKETISFIPHPDKVLIKTTRKDYDELFYKWVTRNDGTKVQLFTSMESEEGMDSKFSQNISCGRIIAVGENVKDVYQSDLAILDYMVTTTKDDVIGSVNGDIMFALVADTTIHDEDAIPSGNLRMAHRKGDYDELSKILGVIRNDKLIAKEPYVFLSKEDSKIVKVSAGGIMHEETPDIVERTVISAFEGSGYEAGDVVVLKEQDMFFRNLGNKEISVCFFQEILYKK